MNIKNYPVAYELEMSHLFILSAAFLLFSLVSSIVVITFVTRFTVKPLHGVFMLGLYLSYNVVVLLITLRVLWPEPNH